MKEHYILHVEDEEAYVFLMRLMFERAGITNPLRAVRDGQMAMDYLAGAGAYADREEHPLPSMVLLDLKLPKASGFEVLKWIREQPALKRLVVIVLSASSHPEDVGLAYDLGANSFIEKPLQMDRTLELVKLLKGWWLESNRFPPSNGSA